MVVIRDGTSASRKGRSRPILSLKDRGGSKNAQLDGEHLSLTNKLTAEQLLEADLWVEARRHREMKRRNGLAGRLHRRDADRALKNALADYRRNGGGV